MDGFCLWGDRKVDCENHELSITYEELLRFSVGYVSMWKCQQNKCSSAVRSIVSSVYGSSRSIFRLNYNVLFLCHISIKMGVF